MTIARGATPTNDSISWGTRFVRAVRRHSWSLPRFREVRYEDMLDFVKEKIGNVPVLYDALHGIKKGVKDVHTVAREAS